MKRTIAAITIVAVLAASWFITNATFADEKPAKKGPACPYCSMDTSKSPTQVVSTYKEEGKDAETVYFQSLGCYMRIAMVDPPEGEFSDVKILDTSTFGSKKPVYVAIEKAWYVPLKSLKMSMPPYLASFAKKSVAKDYASERESSVLSYKEAHKLVMKAVGEEDAEHSHSSHASAEACTVCGKSDECPHESGDSEADDRRDGEGDEPSEPVSAACPYHGTVSSDHSCPLMGTCCGGC